MLDIEIEDPRWQQLALDALATQTIATALRAFDLDIEHSEISLLACDDARIATLNADFRGKPTPTNVLSWPSQERAAEQPGGAPQAPTKGPDGMFDLGDIAISYDTCAREALEAGKEISDHVTHLILHGTLHLLGYDHESEQDAAVMEGIEIEILGKMGLDNPYKES